jgi:ribonuclease G
VQRVLPGMQAAFIDVGLERTAFLHAATSPRRNPKHADRPRRGGEDIRSLVNEGDDILVQVVKDPMGTKGAR